PMRAPVWFRRPAILPILVWNFSLARSDPFGWPSERHIKMGPRSAHRCVEDGPSFPPRGLSQAGLRRSLRSWSRCDGSRVYVAAASSQTSPRTIAPSGLSTAGGHAPIYRLSDGAQAVYEL